LFNEIRKAKIHFVADQGACAFLMFRVFPHKMDGTDNSFIDPGPVFLGIELFKNHFSAIFCRDVMAGKGVQTDGDNIVSAFLAVTEGLVIRAHH
jgi:hypothetical protein